jgi:hypothetical protein
MSHFAQDGTGGDRVNPAAPIGIPRNNAGKA